MQVYVVDATTEDEMVGLGELALGELPGVLTWLRAQRFLAADGTMLTYNGHTLEIDVHNQARLVVLFDEAG